MFSCVISLSYCQKCSARNQHGTRQALTFSEYVVAAREHKEPAEGAAKAKLQQKRRQAVMWSQGTSVSACHLLFYLRKSLTFCRRHHMAPSFFPLVFFLCSSVCGFVYTHLWAALKQLVEVNACLGGSSPHPIFIWCTIVYTVWWTSLPFVTVAFWSSHNCGVEVLLFNFWLRCNSDTFWKLIKVCTSLYIFTPKSVASSSK